MSCFETRTKEQGCGRVVDQVKLEAWRRRLEGFKSSGLSLAAFCRRQNIGPTRLHYWSRKLREAGLGNSQADAIVRDPLGSGRGGAGLLGGVSADAERFWRAGSG